MAEYTVASVVVLVGALALAGWRGVLRRRWAWWGLLVFGLVTVIADVILTGLPIVTYGAAYRSGVAIGPMPIEDLLYGLALYFVALAAWGAAPSTSASPRDATAVGGARS